jgi:CheY-like chemotaxis protein
LDRVPKFLLFGAGAAGLQLEVSELAGPTQFQTAADLDEALGLIRSQAVQGVCLLPAGTEPTELMLEMGGLLRHIGDGLLILDCRGEVLWANEQLARMIGQSEPCVGKSLFDALGATVIMGPEFSPLNRAMLDAEPVRTVLKIGERSYLELRLTPVLPAPGAPPRWLLATVRDTSQETLLNQKHNAIVQAGLELSDLHPEEVRDSSEEERIDVLRTRVLHYTHDILEFDNVEIRLLEADTKRLVPLVSWGLCPDAASRELYANVSGNGVTGYVAATGRTYLCRDTQEDELYLTGVAGARSSLTVPLMLHDQVLGTFNVESAKVAAFNEADQQYLELFCREVALALNTLNLLKVEKAATALEGSRRLLAEVAQPIDAVLHDAVWLLSRLKQHDPEAAARLLGMLQQTRLVREKIMEVGQAISARCGLEETSSHPRLRAKRILVIDPDESVQAEAHDLLAPHGCTVETVPSGEEGLQLAAHLDYDVVLADIKLEDYPGSKIYFALRDRFPSLPVVLMTSFGHDSGHTMIKARSAGMKRGLFKPFKPHLLYATIEENLDNGSAATPV